MDLIKRRHYSLLETGILENRNRYLLSSNWNRKKAIFAGDLLLRYALLKENCDIPNINICYSEYGKPYLRYGKIHFNLSHSMNLIVLGIGKYELGIDILCERKINNEFISFFFSQEEQRYLYSLMEERKREYYWNALCYKEAYIKKSGGKIIDMKNKLVCPENLQYRKVFSVKEKNEKFECLFFHELNYHICLISNKIPKNVTIEILNMDDIFWTLSFCTTSDSKAEV